MNLTNVLLVEDNMDWLKIFHMTIGDNIKDIFLFHHVSDLASAIAEVQTKNYDLILLDLMLPDSQALNTVYQMMKYAEHIPIIILSTLDDDKIVNDSFKCGVEDYLVKDQYGVETFLHVSRKAIKRFLGRFTNSIQEELRVVKSNFQALDKRLEEAEKIYQ